MRSHSADAALAEWLNEATDDAGRTTLGPAFHRRLGPGSELRTTMGGFSGGRAELWNGGELCAAADRADSGGWVADMTLEQEAAGLLASADYHESMAEVARARAVELRSQAAAIASR